MSSNQGHYVGSLPNDYAILARFAHGDEECQGNDRIDECEEADECSVATNRFDAPRRLRPESARRSSSPSAYIRPRSPVISSMNFKSHMTNESISPAGLCVTENTPLLGPLIPRIAEGQPGNEDNNKALMTMFYEEIRILLKYTFPIFGFVPCCYYRRNLSR